MAFELRIGRIPSVSNLIAFSRHVISVTVVIELLCHIPRADSSDSLITILCESVVTIDGHVRKREGLSNFFLLLIARHRYDLYLCRNGVTVVRGLITYYISFQLIATTHGVNSAVSLCLLRRERCIHPSHLPPFRKTILIGHPHAIGQLWRFTYRTADLHGSDTLNGFS